MQSKYLLLNTSVILFFLPGSWCILNPEQEALRKVEILQETLDYIKEYCPLSKEYDDILLCFCQANQNCAQHRYVECGIEMITVTASLSEYVKAACPGGPDKITDLGTLDDMMPNLPIRKPSGAASMPKCNCDY